jgi:hypothetical protein
MPDSNDAIFKEPVQVPGESALVEQLKAIRPVIDVANGSDPQDDEDDLDDPIMKAKKLVVDNYNLHRNKTRNPAMTVQLAQVLWFTGTRGNFKASLEFPVVHGLLYTVSYNARRREAFIDIHKKLSTVQLKDV